ncbi:MAG: S41 family peptidase [Lachnospiraceae bacterium]|nr:S41 family peptidase [Lachnospiraceae bacterium]
MESWKSFLKGVITTLTVIVVILDILIFMGKINLNNIIVKSDEHVYSSEVEEKVSVVCDIIEKYYLKSDDIDKKTFTDSICAGILRGIGDDYAAYFNQTQAIEKQEEINGSYSGIGVIVSQAASSGAFYVTGIYESSPASEAGIKLGDQIIKINEEPTSKMTMDDLVSKVKGETGTSVDLTVKRKKKKHTFTVYRRQIESTTVVSKMLKDDVGYIYISGFDMVTINQFNTAVDELEKAGMKSLIIDLRENGGGLLNVVLSVIDRLLPKDEMVCYTKDKKGTEVTYRTEDNEKVSVPITILVNGHTASASEVLTGCLRDNGYATVIGSQTFGKGIVQDTYDLSDGTKVKFTVSEYYTPADVCIHGVGITPDIKIEDDTGLSINELVIGENSLLEENEAVATALENIRKENE